METPLIFTPVTAFYGGLLATFYIYLSFMVIFQRREQNVGIGDGGDQHMAQVIRVHANFAEYVPFALVLMLIAELNYTHHMWLHISGVALIIARLLHAYGLRHNAGVSWQRFVGASLTFIIYAVLIVLNLLVVY